MSLNSVFENGYRRIKEECWETQRSFFAVIAEARNMPAEWIEKMDAIFIPNNEFMLEYFGQEILEYDCYRGSVCIWDNALIFPIRGANGEVAGLGGFFPFDYVDETTDVNYYAYSSSSVFTKGRYLYFPQWDLIHAINSGYLIVVDGVFDAVSLCGCGFCAASLMGSSPTAETFMQLRFVKHVIVAADNDEAGMKLFMKMKKYLKNVTLFTQGVNKDIDGALKSEKSSEVIESLTETLTKLGICDQNRKNLEV